MPSHQFVHGVTTSLGVLALVLTLAEAAESQEVGGSATGRGFFQVGYLGLDLDEVNASLAAADYPSLDGDFLTLGGGGYGGQDRFLFGGEGHGILGSGETTADGSFELSAGGGYGLFRIGYLVYSGEGLDLFPAIGIGGGGMSLSLKERSAPTFQDVLEDPARSSELSTGMFLLDGSIVLHYRLQLEEMDSGEEGGFLIGLQAGYTFAPGDSSWELDGLNNVAGGPNLQIEGAYLRLSIGGWGREAAQSD